MKITARKNRPHAKWRELGEGTAEVKRIIPGIALAQNAGVMQGRPWFSLKIPTTGETFELQMTDTEARDLFNELGLRILASGPRKAPKRAIFG